MDTSEKAEYVADEFFGRLGQRERNVMTRADILEAARKCVCGDREEDYGSPENNFATIADLWNAYTLAMAKSKDIVVPLFDAQDVAMMMALLKIARIATGRIKADSFIDLAGYAACGGEIATKAGDQLNENY